MKSSQHQHSQHISAPAEQSAGTAVDKTVQADFLSKTASMAATAHDSPSAVVGVKGRPGIDAQQRHHLIEQAAYLHAEHRGFTPGGALDDWLLAQAEIDELYGDEHSTAARHEATPSPAGHGRSHSR